MVKKEIQKGNQKEVQKDGSSGGSNEAKSDEGPPPISSLVFYEMYDSIRLSYIIKNKEIFKKYLNSDVIKKFKREDDDDDETWKEESIFVQLEKYYGSTKFPTNKVFVKYNHKERYFLKISKGERYFAKEAISMQPMCRKIRHSISEKYYYDLDIVNCYVICLIYICKECNISAPLLERYYKNRDKIFSDVISYIPSIKKEFAKQAVLSMIMGGKSDFNILMKTLKDEMEDEIDIEEYYDFFFKFKIEIEDITKKICEHHSLKDSYMKFSAEKSFNSAGKFLSVLMCEVENYILELIFNKIGRNTNVCLCFDGMLIPITLVDKLGGQAEIIKNLEEEIFKHLNVNVKIIFKPLSESFWDTNGKLKIKELSDDFDSFKTIFSEEQSLKKKLLELAKDDYNEHEYGLFIRSILKDIIIVEENGDGYLFNTTTNLWVPRKKDYICSSLKDDFPFVRLTREIREMYKWLNKTNPSGINETLFRLAKNFYKKISDSHYLKNLYDSIKPRLFDETGNLVSKLNKAPCLFPIKGSKVVELKTKEVRQRTSLDYFTWECNVNYPFGVNLSSEEKEEAVRDLNLLIRPIFCENDEHINYMKIVLSSSLTTVNLMRSFFIFLGIGANAKSLLMDIMKLILGPLFFELNRSSIVTNRKAITIENANGHTASLVGMENARLIVVNELKDNDVLNSDIVKKIASNDCINIRAPFETEGQSTRIIGKLFICSNNSPSYDTDDVAIKDRIKFSIFKARFLQSNEFVEGPFHYKRNEDLSDKFKIIECNKWRDAFFNFLIEGCYDYLMNNFKIPKDFTAYKDDNAKDLDSIGIFISENLTISEGSYVKVSDVRAKYVEWVKQMSEIEIGRDNFSKIMVRRLGKTVKKNGGINHYEHYLLR